jgi:transcriptional regulator with XRE-family HTH domain
MMNEVDDGEAVRTFLAREALSQKELAKKAKVSQATVSRALNRQALRPGPARTRLFTFMQQQGVSAGPDSALRALSEIWDGSAEHAAALAKLVRASGELWPNLAGK